jgi:hypothetical protein
MIYATEINHLRTPTTAVFYLKQEELISRRESTQRELEGNYTEYEPFKKSQSSL